ncbi:MAG TPA: hypothetical protein VGI63_08770 [Verrucomicrobiae bacterium]|jgi:hypothetical protein
MKIAKVIIGIGFLIAALFLLPFAWGCFQVGVPWFKPIPVLFEIGLIAFGILLIRKRQQPLSKKSKILLVLFLVFAVLMPAILDFKIRADRKALQLRAQAFLLRPIPTAILPNSEGYIDYEYFGTNEVFGTNQIDYAERQIMGGTQPLIKRYAKTGRIRWSAMIQGEFAITGEHLNFPNSDDVERTNKEVRAWLVERNAILGAEWRMGFWQWVEDTIEMKLQIPEIEEEDFHPASATNGVSH